MNWNDITGTDVEWWINECLTERPFLQSSELLERLASLSIFLELEDLENILQDPESPYFHEPIRWFLGTDVQLDEFPDSLESVDSSTEDLAENSTWIDAGPSSIRPTRWIGPVLRDWQRDAFMAWVNNSQQGIIEAITGTGKTLVGIYAAAYALDYGYKVAITAPTLELMDQWVEQLHSCIIDLKLGRLDLANSGSIEDNEILITTIASGSKYRLHATDTPTLLITDEVHRMGSPKYSEALEPEMEWRMGLTATLERTNDAGVEDILLPYFDSVVYSYSYPDGLSDGVLAPFRLGFMAIEFTPEEEMEFNELGSEMSRIRKRLEQGGHLKAKGNDIFGEIGAMSRDNSQDFKIMRLAQKFMANLSARKQIQATAKNKILAMNSLARTMSEAQRGLVFTETKESALHTSELLKNNGITALPFDSSLKRPQRIERLKAFKSGDIQILCAPRVLDEGIDVSNVDIGVILSASQSKRQMIQRLGRIVRPNPDGSPSTLFLTYIKGTREDPAEGGHEGFLDEVLPHATVTEYFDVNSHPDTILAWHRNT
jgi:superfamily II DNA or RNA helicase